MGKKVANGLSGCTDNPHRLDPIKKGRFDDPFCPKFLRRPEVRTDKRYRGQALVPIVPFSIWESASLCGVMRVFRNVNRIYPESYGRVTLVSRRLYNDIATRSNPS